MARMPGFIGKVKSFFLRHDPGGEDSYTRKTGRKFESKDDFNRHLKKTLRSQTRVTAGKLQIISLDKIRGFVTEDWDSFAAKMRTTINNVIMRRLGPRDSFTRTNDDTYIIVFDKLSKEDAELECVLIVQEVLRTLFIDKNLDERVDIRTVAVGVDGKIDVEEVNLLDIIMRLLQEEQTAAEKKAADKPPAAQAQQQENTQVPDAATAEPPEKDGAKPGGKGRAAAEIMHLNATAGALSRNLGFEYWPLWDVKRKALSTYACNITDGKSSGYALLGKNPDRRQIPTLDFLTIGRVTHELRRLQASQRRLIIYCPVHIETLSGAGPWTTYNMLCERIAQGNLSRDLVFEIFGVDTDTDMEKLNYHAAKLQRYCRQIIVRTTLADVPFQKFGSGIFAHLSTDLNTFDGPEKRQMKLMDEYTENVQALKMGAIIFGLKKMSHVTAAVGSGFSRIGGDFIHAPIARPEFIYRFEAMNLLNNLMG